MLRRMTDEEPWFRPWFGFSFYPIRWKGWAATVIFAAVEVSLGVLSFNSEDGSVSWWLYAATLFVIFLLFWAFVLSKAARR